jgi:hypothetical protein
MSFFGIKSREEIGDHLRTVARIAAGSRAEWAAWERKAALRRDRRQITIGQILLLVALWALGLALWRLNR